MDGSIAIEKIDIPLGGSDTIVLTRFCGDPAGIPVLMIHGAIENGRIFHSRSGKGLGPWLASRGFDVFVADLRGHGESSPPVSRHTAYGQTEIVLEELPAVVEALIARRGRVRQAWVAHSWGGVLLNAFLARYPEYASLVGSAVYFGSKRSVRAITGESLLKVWLIWELVCPIVASVAGYLPAARMGIGSDDESRRYLMQCLRWVRESRWVDPADGFDYGEAIRRVAMPPIWYIAAAADGALGHPDDVRAFMESSGTANARFTILSREAGNMHNYDHIDMLTHADATRDHFPAVADWLASAGARLPSEGRGGAADDEGAEVARGRRNHAN
ncbi:MAG TPA: alpha/beta fold hydrolase [Rectinemataceae bacterium]|nr:alpha/beta fold hydrolase [Rectinemataceae bacterium]